MPDIIQAEPPVAPPATSVYQYFHGDQHHSISRQEALVIRNLMKARVDPQVLRDKWEDEGKYPAPNSKYWPLAALDEAPFSYYPWAEAALSLVDRILDTHGIESITGDPPEDDCWSNDCNTAFMYCNSGDTYSRSVLFVPTKDRFYLCSWGDMVESLERQGWRFV